MADAAAVGKRRNQFTRQIALMSASALIFTYVTVLLATICGLSIYTEMRRRRFRPSGSEDRIFRCERCGFVYTDDPDVERSRCSQCAKLNEAIKF